MKSVKNVILVAAMLAAQVAVAHEKALEVTDLIHIEEEEAEMPEILKPAEDYRREIFSKLLEDAWCEFLLQLESEEAPQA